MKWICGFISIVGLYLLSCRNNPDTAEDTSSQAVGPSQAIDSMKVAGLSTNTSTTGSLKKTDTLPKIIQPIVDTFPKKNP